MFNFNRMINLIKRIIVINKKSLLYGFLTIIFVVALNCIGFVNAGSTAFIVCMMTIIVGVYAFEGYTKPALRANNILLPATVQEKYFANLVFAFIILPIYIMIAVTIGTVLRNIITILLQGGAYHYSLFFGIKELFTDWNIDAVLSALFSMSIFFFGSLFFKKNRIVMTIVSFFTFFAIFGIVFVSIHYMIYSNNNFRFEYFNNIDIIPKLIEIITTLFFLVLSYFRLKEERI
jgi:hypothetical protein